MSAKLLPFRNTARHTVAESSLGLDDLDVADELRRGVESIIWLADHAPQRLAVINRALDTFRSQSWSGKA